MVRLTPLYDRHRSLGGRLVNFAGWEMPIQYAGLRIEHEAVRKAAGVFDVSHMGEVETVGRDALVYLQHVLSNDVSSMIVGGAQYSVLCREDGGVLDDLFTYRLAQDRFLTVTNAANHVADLEWMRSEAIPYDVELNDGIDRYAMLAVQGPDARGIAAPYAAAPLPARMTASESTFAGVPALICGTGYTGEDGLELLVSPENAVHVWDSLLDSGVVPAGLGARDTLRLEACFHLYGHELTPKRDPVTSGLGWCCKEVTGFVGSDRIAEVRAAGPTEKLVAFILSEGIPRAGNPVVGGGTVTSGSMSPTLGCGVGMAFVPAERSDPGTQIDVDVRGRIRKGEIVRKPLYRREES